MYPETERFLREFERFVNSMLDIELGPALVNDIDHFIFKVYQAGYLQALKDCKEER